MLRMIMANILTTKAMAASKSAVVASSRYIVPRAKIDAFLRPYSKRLKEGRPRASPREEAMLWLRQSSGPPGKSRPDACQTAINNSDRTLCFGFVETDRCKQRVF